MPDARGRSELPASAGGATPVGGGWGETDPVPVTAEQLAAHDGDGAPVAPSPGSATGEPRRVTGRWARLRARRQRSAHRRSPWWEMPVLIAVAILVAIGVKTFLVQPFYIPSASMEKTLHGCPGCTGDRILVNKTVYHFRDPHPGDIVVFRLPPAWADSSARAEVSAGGGGNPLTRAVRWFGQLVGFVPPNEKDLVKRVIAVGGQTVQCCDPQGRVQVSDSGLDGPWRSLDEPYVFTDGAGVAPTFGPVTVPQGRLWVMGDHRNDSADSRVHCGTATPAQQPGGAGATAGVTCDPVRSTVSVDDVIGKAIVIIWPMSRWGTLGTPSTFQAAAAVSSGPAPTSSTAGSTAGSAIGSGIVLAAAVPIPAVAVFAAALMLGWVRRRRRRSRVSPALPGGATVLAGEADGTIAANAVVIPAASPGGEIHGGRSTTDEG